MKQKKIKLYLPSIIVFLLFNAAFVTLTYWDYYYSFKYICIIVIAVYIVFNMKKSFFNKRY